MESKQKLPVFDCIELAAQLNKLMWPDLHSDKEVQAYFDYHEVKTRILEYRDETDTFIIGLLVHFSKPIIVHYEPTNVKKDTYTSECEVHEVPVLFLALGTIPDGIAALDLDDMLSRC